MAQQRVGGVSVVDCWWGFTFVCADSRQAAYLILQPMPDTRFGLELGIAKVAWKELACGLGQARPGWQTPDSSGHR